MRGIRTIAATIGTTLGLTLAGRDRVNAAAGQ